MSEPRMYIGNEGRAEEQSDLQRALDEQKPAQEKATTVYETMREYTALLKSLPEYVEGLSQQMEEMRAAGIPDRAAYEKARDGLTHAYDQFRDVSRRMAFLVEDPKKGGTGSHDMAQILKDALVKESDRLEDGYIVAIEADAKWHAAQEMDQYGRREGDHAPYVERKEPLELYDEKVVGMLKRAMEFESILDAAEKSGTMNEEDREVLRYQVVDLFEKLEELGRSAAEGVSGQSAERRSLVDLLQKLSRRLRRERVVSELHAARAVHRQVRAQYVAVQHKLTDAQRREMRTHLGRLSDLVQQAENEALAQTFAPPPPPEPPAPKKDIRDIKEAITLAMSRAATTAPIITGAVLPPPPKKGMFAVLGDAFKLK